MTREEFELWPAANNIPVPRGSRIEGCTCGDVNCRGWRIVR